MRGPWTRTVARETFELRLPGAEPRTVTVEVGEPYPSAEGEWACPVALHGLDGRLVDIRGTSSLQALCLAIAVVRQRLEDQLERGAELRVGDAGDSREEEPLSKEELARMFGAGAARGIQA